MKFLIYYSTQQQVFVTDIYRLDVGLISNATQNGCNLQLYHAKIGYAITWHSMRLASHWNSGIFSLLESLL